MINAIRFCTFGARLVQDENNKSARKPKELTRYKEWKSTAFLLVESGLPQLVKKLHGC